jgi:plasmid stabilization system protein ParE
MRSGYKLFWSERAEYDLKNIIDYLTTEWSENEVRNFAQRLDKRLELITINPKLFPASKRRKSIRRSVLTRQITIYYHFSIDAVTILTLFDTRISPTKLKL